MKSWARSTLISFVLVGGTVFFAYHSLNELNTTLDNISAAYIAIADTRAISLSNKTNGDISTTTLETASTTEVTIATTTPIIISTVATAASVKLSFVFPPKNSEVYVGCTYQIPLQASTTIHSLGAALIDTSTGEAVGPIASGLAKVTKIESDAQSLDWKVGAVWPGEYSILISKANDIEIETKSKSFMIRAMPKDISASKRGTLCKEADGFFAAVAN